MKWLKSFKKHKESLDIDLQIQSIDLMESLNIWHDVLLNAINAEELDIFDTLELPEDIKGLDLNILSDNAEFINSLTKKALRKSQLEDTDTLATFVKPCKFMFIYAQPNDDKEKEGGENLIYLENPVYIIFQNKNDGAVRLYKVNSDVNNFYNKWLEDLDYINVTMRSIRKVQCDCSLLDLCHNNPEVMDKEYDGYVFDKINRNDGLYQFVVFLPELKLSSRITMRDNYDNFECKKFKLYLFNNEEKFKRKIRLQLM